MGNDQPKPKKNKLKSFKDIEVDMKIVNEILR